MSSKERFHTDIHLYTSNQEPVGLPIGRFHSVVTCLCVACEWRMFEEGSHLTEISIEGFEAPEPQPNDRESLASGTPSFVLHCGDSQH